MKRLITVLFLMLGPLAGLSTPALSQERAWVQVEAQPTLTSAQDRARFYTAQLSDVVGYYLGSGWYGIALGPYERNDAEALLTDLRRRGIVPGDSFISDGSRFQQQFWPVGIGAATEIQPLPQGVEALTPVTEDPVVAESVVVPLDTTLPDETLSQARASEAALSEDDRKMLQIALRWAGYYDSAIDGAFGRGTRASMAAWQAVNNHEQTGVLTTAQRAQLLGQYTAVLEGLGMDMVRDADAGVAISMPTDMVAFGRYEPPFARYEPVAGAEVPARVLLMSQRGDQDRFFGLYEILQTLEVVPTDGPRRRTAEEFEIEGQNAEIHSYTYAVRDGDIIKGFILVWPAGDEERRSRVAAEMKASFSTFGGTLNPAIVAPDEDQAIDLVSGLAVRQPRLSGSGFYVDPAGAVLTSAATVASCDRVTIDTVTDMTVAWTDPALGLALLRPVAPLAPIAVARFQTSVPRIGSMVAAGGYPYGGALTMPTLTFGTLADIRGLNGEETVKRLSLVAQDGDVGGPVYDEGGAVLGMLLPRLQQNGQVLPPDVTYIVETDAIVPALVSAGVAVLQTATVDPVTPEAMTASNADTTVLVGCW